MGRLLAVDLGTVRVGLAISDPLKMIASPLTTLAYKTEERLIRELLAIIDERDVETVIVGLPLKEDGSEGEGCRLARSFAGRLREQGQVTALWDERYSSRRAESLLMECGFNRRQAVPKIDKIAASFILEDYMQSNIDLGK